MGNPFHFLKILLSLVALLSLSACMDSTVETTKVRPGSSAGGSNSNSSGAPVFSFASSQATYSLNVPFALAPSITYSGTGLTFNIIGTLPTGLSIDSSTGAITGIPTSGPGSSIYMILATNTSGSSFETLELLTGPVFSYSASQYDYIVGNAFTAILPTVTYPTSGAILYSVSPALPSGLSLNTFTGEISGTPTAASVDVEFTITATANGESNSIILDINEAAPPNIAYSASYDYVRSTAFSQSPTLTYTGANFSLAINAGSLPAGLSLNATTGAITGTPIGSGDQTVTIRASNDYGFNDHVINFAEVGPPIFASTTMSGTFYRSVAFSLDIEATLTFPTAANVSYSISPALPNASCTSLSLNTTTGVISGTVSVSSTTDSNCARAYTVTATNNDDPLLRTRTLTITLSEDGPPQFIYLAGTHTYQYGVAFSALTPTVYYSGTLSAPAYTLTNGSLPPGLSLNATTGVISGTPTGTVDPLGAAHTIEITLTNTFGSTVYSIDLEEVGIPRISYANLGLTYYRNDDVVAYPNVLETPTIDFCKGGCGFTTVNLPVELEVDMVSGEIRVQGEIPTKIDTTFTVEYYDGYGNVGSFNFTFTEACNDTGNIFAGQSYGGGAGTAGDPWLTCTSNHLIDLNTNPSGYFKQMADVDLTGHTVPLTTVTCFSGGYDGNDKIISNLKIFDGAPGSPIAYPARSGMFHCLEDFDYIRNLTLLNSYSYGDSAVGVIAGSADIPALPSPKNRLIERVNIYNSHLLDNGSGYVGGLIGMIECNDPTVKITISNNIFHGVLEKNIPTGLMSSFFNSNSSGPTGECVDAQNNVAFLENNWGTTNFINPPPGVNFDANDSVNIGYPGIAQLNVVVDLNTAVTPWPVRSGVDSWMYLDGVLTSDGYWNSLNFPIGDYKYTSPASGPGLIVPRHLCDREATEVVMLNLAVDSISSGGGGLVCQ